MRVLVTGGTSPVGAALARKLIADGHEVTVLSRGRDHHRLDGLDCRICPGDVRHAGAVHMAAKDCDAVVHAAFAPAGESPQEILDVAFAGTAAVLEACGSHGIQNLLLVSSPLADDPHPGPYGTGKRAAEMLAADWAEDGVPARLVIARPYNVYGPDCGYGHVIPQLIMQLRDLIRSGVRDPLPFPLRGDGTEVRSFIHADDCAARLAAWLGGTLPGAVTADIGTSDLRTIASVSRDIAACAGRQIRIMPSPPPPGVPRVRVTPRGLPPVTPFAGGLAQTVAWYREHDQEAGIYHG